jgi:hypothetical protein
MLAARVFFLAAVFKVRTSVAVHARRFDFLVIEVSPVGQRKRPLVAEIKEKQNKKVTAVALSFWSEEVRERWLIGACEGYRCPERNKVSPEFRDRSSASEVRCSAYGSCLRCWPGLWLGWAKWLPVAPMSAQLSLIVPSDENH